jgi:hypothetical protein
MNNEQLYEKAMQAITSLFNDTSVSRSECRRNLEELIGEIKTMIDSLDTDERNELDETS